MKSLFGSFPLLAAAEESFWFTKPASAAADGVDSVFYFIYAICLVFFVGIMAAMVLFVFQYRRRDPALNPVGPSHNTPLEVFWTVVPLGLVMVIFWKGFVGYLDLTTPPQKSYQISVTARKWAWQFTYPNGAIDNNLHIPVDTPVELVMRADDVSHAFYVPDFRVQMNCVPGRYTKVWLQARETTQKGEPGHEIFCAQYCGQGHSTMLARVIVHPKEGEDSFDKWVADAGDLAKSLGRENPVEAGRKLYNTRGCATCHSLEPNKVVIGPSFGGGEWNELHEMSDGQMVPFNEDYVRESILYPQAKIRKGYGPVMPTFKGSLTETSRPADPNDPLQKPIPSDIDLIIAFLKDLKKK